jgi:parallel beta-helix repeat protein
MKAAAKGILLSVSQMIVILALVLVPFTGAIDENVTAGNTTDGVWSNISDDILSDESSVTSLEMWNRTYNESVVLDKRLTLYSKYGANVTIVDAGGSGNALTIKADSCTVDGFMATGNGHYPGDAGIKVESNGNIIMNNSIHDVHTMGSSDIRNSSAMITYAYNDSQYTGYIGNYWRDYCTADTNSDGVGDEPYGIYKGLSPGKYEVASGYPLGDGSGRWENDSYPLIRPFTFYVMENVLPIIDFTVSLQEPEVKKSVTFNASSCYDPDGAIIVYHWDFGDGNITSTAERIITHFFRSTGNYTVTLTVTDNSSAISSTSKVIAIPHANRTSYSISAPMGVPMPTVHNLNTSGGFFSIQAAIYDSNTTDGHTIVVDTGTYRENVKVNKSVTIRATSGNRADTIVQAEHASDHVFNISAESVKLVGFTIKGATGEDKAGIHLSSSDNIIIDNNVSSNFIGIALSGSRENTIINNTANSNTYAGFAFFNSSDNNTIDDNMATGNWRGLIIYPRGGGSYNTISNNHFDRNYDGISIWGLYGRSDNNVIVNNSATYNYDGGLFIINSSGNIIENNNFSYTQWYSGIELWGISSNNKINKNVANSNGATGICLLQSDFPGSPSNNTITNNYACFNKYSGIQLTDSASYNTITNNSACFNNAIGIALSHSCGSNIISNNELYSNLIGLSIKGADISNNQIVNNTVSLSNSYGIWLADLRYTNAITHNNVSKNNLFGIFVLNSTNNSISDNTANLNERGIGLKW